MSIFSKWSEFDVAAHNAKAKKLNTELHGEGCSDESKLHEQILAECRHRGFYVVHSRMDKRTTQQKGVPDFIIAAHGKTYWIEAKAKGKKLTPEQQGTLNWLQMLGHPAEVVYSLKKFLLVIATPPQPNDAVKP